AVRLRGDAWSRQGLVVSGREPRSPSGLVKQTAKRSTCQQAVDSRPRGLGRKVSVEAASAPRGVEASCSGPANRMSVAQSGIKPEPGARDWTSRQADDHRPRGGRTRTDTT